MNGYYPAENAVVRRVTKMSKRELADWLAGHGTIYPTAATMARWSKDELVNGVLDRMRDLYGQVAS